MNVRHYPLWLLIIVFALALPWTAATQEGPSKAECVAAGLKTCKPLTAFVATLRNAVQAGNKNAVADLMTYPIEIQLKDGLEIKDKADFVAHYDTIMTPSLRDAITQEPFVTPRQIIQLVGEKAQIWLYVDNGTLRIGTIIIE